MRLVEYVFVLGVTDQQEQGKHTHTHITTALWVCKTFIFVLVLKTNCANETCAEGRCSLRKTNAGRRCARKCLSNLPLRGWDAGGPGLPYCFPQLPDGPRGRGGPSAVGGGQSPRHTLLSPSHTPAHRGPPSPGQRTVRSPSGNSGHSSSRAGQGFSGSSQRSGTEERHRVC